MHLAPDEWVRVLGVDLGWEDDNAFVLTGYHPHDPNCYVMETYAHKRWTFDEVERFIIEHYCRNSTLNPHKIFIDGANKQGVESMRMRTNIPFEYADKIDKVTFIELCKADMVQGKIKIVDNGGNQDLIRELCTLTWLTDNGKIVYPKKENPLLPNHRTDALLYGWRNGFHYHWAPKEVKVPMYSPQWYDQQAQNVWEKEREKMIQEAEEQVGWSQF